MNGRRPSGVQGLIPMVFMMVMAGMVAVSMAVAQSGDEGWSICNQAREDVNRAVSGEDFLRAQEKFEKALEIFENANSQKGVAFACFEIGSIREDLGDYEKALEYYEKSLEIRKRLGDVKGQGITLNNVGGVYKARGSYQQALDYYGKALEIHRKTGNVKEQGTTLNNIASVFNSWDQYANAIEHYSKALELEKSIRDIKGEAITLNNIGEVYRSLGQYQKAIDYYEKSLGLKKEIGDSNGERATLNNIGLVYDSWGQPSKALDYFEKALEIQRRMGDVLGQSITLNNIAGVYKSWGQYRKAIDYYDKSMEIRATIGDLKGKGITLNNLGSVYDRAGMLEMALETYERALETRRQVGDVYGEAVTLGNMGTILAAQGKPDQALSNFQKVLEVKKRLGVPTDWGNYLIGNLYLDMGQIKEAEPFIRECGYYKSLGRLYLMKSDYSEAKNQYKKLLELAEKTHNADSLFIAYTGLGRIHEHLEEYREAEEYYEKGLKFTEEIRSSLLPSERKDFFSVKIDGFSRSDPGKGLTRVRMKLNEAAGSIDSSEATRARAFSDNLFQRASTESSGVPRDVLEKDDQLVARLASLKKELGKTDGEKTPERFKALLSEVRNAEADHNAFKGLLWARHRSYASVKYPRPVTLKESGLKPEEYVVMFDCSEEGVGVKLIKGKEIVQTSYSKWKLADLEKDVQDFRRSFEKFNLQELNSDVGLRLYRRLLAPVLGQVPEGSPLIIIPDGVLALLPFDALVVGGKATWKTGGVGDFPVGLTYFADVHPVSYYQSVTALTLAREASKGRKPGNKLLVLADPVFDLRDSRAQAAGAKKVAAKEGVDYPRLMSAIEESFQGFRFARLPETGVLAERMAAVFGSRCDAFRGLHADKEWFINTLSPKIASYGQILFATHGLFSDHIPGLMEPFLALTMVPPGKDGFLRMSDVMGLKINADLVALTACQTGLGRQQTGEGVMSMGRAFQYAGARSVLMSLWSVAEASSVNLMEQFFRYRKEGKSKLDALKLARQDIRRDGYEHPFFWAPFILVGETD